MNDFECLEHETIDNVSIVRFREQRVMDPERIELMGSELLSLIKNGDTEGMVVNFANVRFFSSAAINKLIVLEKHVRARGGEIRLTNLQQEVRDLFSYTHLDEVFQIRDDQEEAIRSLRG